NWTAPGLPAGLTLSSSTGTTVTISGTPTTPGQYSYTVTVFDSNSPVQSASQGYSGTITSVLTLNCSPLTGPTQVGVAYSATCTASGGTPGYTWAAPGLPAGLTLSTSTGTTVTISGTPTTAGQYSYTVTVTDVSSPVQSANRV